MILLIYCPKTSWSQTYCFIFHPQNRSFVLGPSWLKTGTSYDCRQTESRYWVCRTHPVLISNTECQEESQLQHTCKVSRTGKPFMWWEMWWWWEWVDTEYRAIFVSL